MEAVNKRNGGAELSTVLDSQKEVFLSQKHLCPDQRKAFNDILHCRTSQMGSHSLCCDSCGTVKVCYNSCRNRHCPKCQYIKQQLWVEKLKCRLLPVRYFHAVFTVPEFLNPLFYINQRFCYNLLFECSAKAVKKTALNPAFLGVESGCLSVLHTWGQSLNYHPHIHMLVPAGGLDSDGMQWLYAGKKFFVPVKALSSVFRGLFMERLLGALEDNLLRIPEGQKELFADIKSLKKESYAKMWNVYIKKTFRGAGQVVSYLGRYTHRVAISNSRILDTDGETVKFRWKDYRDNKTKTMLLACSEFVRRFMQHVLPTGFYKIRYYGILASANSNTKMNECFRLLNITREVSFYHGLSTYEVMEEIFGEEMFRCTCCKNGRMVFAPPEGKANGP
ncbi:Transposase zinc-binding domain-containing protein [Aquiflexum balticum DSM 16537]|uniref:Transposase zinc-binding domain-containing protein n=1 Tax=Aquiflexum balticum DSM 16537 TaxID=758820 RepID=A0A1W2H0R6_9BACT|nr:IS91 family transposase [Aquiflexum balticum]SMD42520.1 Transposase zinc-binding domain-containing protein [Aquiflexum balticum DSM 16537]